MATEGAQSESKLDLGCILGSKMVPKMVQNPTWSKSGFLQPLTHIIKVFNVQKASNFNRNLLKKVMSKRALPKGSHFEVPGSLNEEKVPKKL